MKFNLFYVPTNKKEWWNQIIIYWIFIISLLTLQRIIFFFLYLPQGMQQIPLKDILSSLLIGIRFDIAVLPIFMLIYHILLFLFYYLLKKNLIFFSFYKKIGLFLFIMEWYFILFLLLSNFASILNFEVNNKHLGWEYFAYFKDLPLFIQSIYTKNPEIIFILLLFIFLWSFFIFFIIKKTYNNILLNKNSNFSLIDITLYIIINIIFIRGGFQQNPLRPADALTSSNHFINQLKLNGIFTIIHDASDTDDFCLYFSVKENIDFVKNFLITNNGGDPFVSEKYPLLRYMQPRNVNIKNFETSITHNVKNFKYNFIVIVLESWSAKFLKPYNHYHSIYPVEVAPNFNRISSEGVLFLNSFASGGRSANGIFCILTGIPDRAGRTIFRSNQIFNRFGALPYILKEKGYISIFIHSGDLNFDNLKTALPHLGFDTLIGKEEIQKTKKDLKTWDMGYFDEDLYDISIEMIQKIRQPFFLMIFTSNNHHPYTVPDAKFEIFPASDIEHKFKNSYHYSDHALGKFIDKLNQSPFMDNTIVIIVADHTHHANLNFYEDRQIPLLFYSPKNIHPQIRTDIVSQLDILPTILSLTGGNTFYSSIGRDLTIKNYEDYAFFAGGSNTDIIGLIKLPYINYYYFHSKEKFLFQVDSKDIYNNLANKLPDIAYKMDNISKHLYQISRYLEKENLVWPIESDYSILKKQWLKE